jgi:hypothetical protein
MELLRRTAPNGDMADMAVHLFLLELFRDTHVGARAPQTDQRGHYEGCHLYDPKEVGARAPQGCVWTFDNDMDSPKWDTGCGEAYCFIDGGPTENGVKYCPFCGSEVQIPAPPDHAPRVERTATQERTGEPAEWARFDAELEAKKGPKP